MLDRNHEELERKYRELQAQYDELRILFEQTGRLVEDVAKEPEKRPRLTIIKGGLAAIVGLLGTLLLRSKQHRVIAATLTACTMATGGAAVWTAITPTPPSVSGSVPVTPKPRRRATPAVRPSVARRPSQRHRSHDFDGTVAVFRSHAPTPPVPVPAVTVPLPHSSPLPSPIPLPSPPIPKPHPTHSRHCILYSAVLGQRVCIKFGWGVPSG